jgi:hypothetical protein
MKHQIESHHRLILPAIYLASLLLLLIGPVSSTAQTELRVDRQILLEAKHGTVALRHGLDDRLFLTAIKQKSPKFACF